MVKNTTSMSTTPSSISSVNQKPTTTPTEKKTSTTVTAPVVDNVKSSTKSTAAAKLIVSVKKETYSKQPEFSQEKQKTQLKQGQKTQKTKTMPIKSKIIKNTHSIKNTEVLQGQQRPAKNLSDTEKNTTVSTMISSNEKLAKQQEQSIPNTQQTSTTQKTQPLEPTVSTKQVQAPKVPTQQPENSQLSSSENTQLEQGKEQKTGTTQSLAEPVVATPIIQQGAAVLKENVSNFMEFKAENEGANRSKNGFILLRLLQQKNVKAAGKFVSQCNGIIDFNVFDRDTEDFPLQAAIRNKQRDFVEYLSQQPIRTSNFGCVARFIASEYVDAYRRNDNDTVRYYVDIWNNIKENYIRQQQTIFGKNSSYIGKTREFCCIIDSCFSKKEFAYKEITQAGKDLTIARTKAMQTMVDGDVKRILQQDNPESYNSNSIRMNGLNGNYSTLSTRPLMQSMRVVQPMPVMQPIQVMPVMQPIPVAQPMQVMPVMQQMRPMQPMQVMPAMPVMQSMRVVQSMPAMQPRQVIQSTPATIVRVNRNQGNRRGNGNSIGGL